MATAKEQHLKKYVTLKVLKMWSSVPQVCHMDKMDIEQSAHDKTVHKNMMTIAKLQQ